MAKKSKIEGDARRREVVARHAQRRAALKRAIADPTTGTATRAAALAELARQPRDASATRLRNRDLVDGRLRGICGHSGCPGYGCARWPCAGSCPGCARRAGSSHAAWCASSSCPVDPS
jgi:small subunit ribosomal protein S14